MPSSPAAPTKLVPLGKNGPLIPQLGLGLMGLTHQVYGSNPTEEEQFAFLDRAYELGARNWDTSECAFLCPVLSCPFPRSYIHTYIHLTKEQRGPPADE